jgi:hypothetical protein
VGHLDLARANDRFDGGGEEYWRDRISHRSPVS